MVVLFLRGNAIGLWTNDCANVLDQLFLNQEAEMKRNFFRKKTFFSGIMLFAMALVHFAQPSMAEAYYNHRGEHFVSCHQRHCGGRGYGWQPNVVYHPYVNPNVQINQTTQLGSFRHCQVVGSSNPGLTSITQVSGPNAYGQSLWQESIAGTVLHNSTNTANVSCF